MKIRKIPIFAKCFAKTQYLVVIHYVYMWCFSFSAHCIPISSFLLLLKFHAIFSRAIELKYYTVEYRNHPRKRPPVKTSICTLDMLAFQRLLDVNARIAGYIMLAFTGRLLGRLRYYALKYTGTCMCLPFSSRCLGPPLRWRFVAFTISSLRRACTWRIKKKHKIGG